MVAKRINQLYGRQAYIQRKSTMRLGGHFDPHSVELPLGLLPSCYKKNYSPVFDVELPFPEGVPQVASGLVALLYAFPSSYQ